MRFCLLLQLKNNGFFFSRNSSSNYSRASHGLATSHGSNGINKEYETCYLLSPSAIQSIKPKDITSYQITGPIIPKIKRKKFMMLGYYSWGKYPVMFPSSFTSKGIMASTSSFVFLPKLGPWVNPIQLGMKLAIPLLGKGAH